MKKKRINSRRKGHQFERDFAQDLRDRKIDLNAKRHLEYQKQEAKRYDIDDRTFWQFQCKCGKNPDVWEICKEPDINLINDKLWFAWIIKRTKHRKPCKIAVMKYEHFLDMVSEFMELSQK